MTEVFWKTLPFFKNKTVLFTGSSGYIASCMTAALSSINCRLVRLTRNAARLHPVSGAFQVNDIEVDITSDCDWSRILDGVNIVFHLASQTSVATADQDPARDFLVNVKPLMDILNACTVNGYRPVIVFAGTTTEIGIPHNLPVSENHYEAPITIYDIHKLVAEKYLKFHAGAGRIRGCTLRLSNVYGPGPKSSSADRGILNLMIRKALNGESLTLYGNGEQVRDYIYIDDAANAFFHAAVHIGKADGRHFVIGSGTGHTIAEAFRIVAERVAAKTGRKVEVIHITPPGGLSPIETRNFFADITEFSAATGWIPRYPLAEGVDRTIDYFMSQGAGS
jgi:nucleoside-diphosphate-sugar epimerase